MEMENGKWKQKTDRRLIFVTGEVAQEGQLEYKS